MIDVLLEILLQVKDKNTKAFILEKYVQEFGAIPNEYAEAVREVMVSDEAD